MKKPFYTHIAGLRAWAVTLVCLYHFNIAGFDGGFIGVDIFFVISGFLMGGILDRILGDPKRKKYWIFEFILARAQRIMPALFVVVLLVMPWAWFRIGVLDFKASALEGLRTIFFVSNHYYAQKTDYFAESEDLRFFLHSWSLSVEWGFYIIIAILAFLASHIKRASELFILATISFSLASFIWMLTLRQGNQMEAFFYLMPRAWELGVGILAWHISKLNHPTSAIPKHIIECIGFALIGFCMIIISDEENWPGPATLLPVIGTSLILLAGNERSTLTTPRPLQGIGEISYSVYLWHWPIAVMLNHEKLLDETLWKFVGIAASFVVGTSSWWLVERPTRRFFGTRGQCSKSIFLLSALLLTGSVFAVIRKFDGFPQRLGHEVYEEILSAKERSELDRKCMSSEHVNKEPCHIGYAGTPSLLIFGDSHAGAMLEAISTTDYAQHNMIEVWAKNGCRPIFELRDQKGFTDCALFLKHVEKRVSGVPPSVPLIVISRFPATLEGENSEKNRQTQPVQWLGNRPLSFDEDHRAKMINGLAEGICRIGKGRKIFVFAPVPDFTRDPLSALEKSALRGTTFVSLTMPREDVVARQASSLAAIRESSRICGAEMISVIDAFCDDTVCRSVIDGAHAYRDDDHLSRKGAEVLVPRFEKAISIMP